MDDRPRVLFLCTGNSCRSQMAEGWLRHLAGERYVVLSAGTHPQGVHPLAVWAMDDAGVDIRTQTSDPVDQYFDDPPEHVVSVCTPNGGFCPAFPGQTVVCWVFEDPADAKGSRDEIKRVFRKVRDEIRASIEGWLVEQQRSALVEG